MLPQAGRQKCCNAIMMCCPPVTRRIGNRTRAGRVAAGLPDCTPGDSHDLRERKPLIPASAASHSPRRRHCDPWRGNRRHTACMCLGRGLPPDCRKRPELRLGRLASNPAENGYAAPVETASSARRSRRQRRTRRKQKKLGWFDRRGILHVGRFSSCSSLPSRSSCRNLISPRGKPPFMFAANFQQSGSQP